MLPTLMQARHRSTRSLSNIGVEVSSLSYGFNFRNIGGVGHNSICPHPSQWTWGFSICYFIIGRRRGRYCGSCWKNQTFEGTKLNFTDSNPRTKYATWREKSKKSPALLLNLSTWLNRRWKNAGLWWTWRECGFFDSAFTDQFEVGFHGVGEVILFRSLLAGLLSHFYSVHQVSRRSIEWT